jgi:hypothetical protein
MGPPELRLFTNDAGDRVEPYAPPPVPSSAPLARASGPSDFTRMLTPVEAPPAAAAPPPVRPNAKPDAPAGRKPSILPLIIVLNVALIIAVGLLLFFALRDKPTP